MYNFDSLSLKYFLRLNCDFLKNAAVQKVQQPSRREIILNLRSGGESKKIYININPKYPHICFIDEKTFNLRNLKIPKMPPMFCMQLRKYVEGARIKEITIPDYERIIEFHFEVWDQIGQLINLCLAVEIMGRHSNVILYNWRNKNILGTAHNISSEKSSIREIYGGIPYIYPPKQNKTDILKTSYGAFRSVLEDADDIKGAISLNYYYFSEPLAQIILNKSSSKEELFKNLQQTVSFTDTSALSALWGGENFNAALDNYFSKLMFEDIFCARQACFLKIVKTEVKKLSKILIYPPNEEKALKYKRLGDLIFQYIYLIKEGDTSFTPEGAEKIELDSALSPSQNAQNYYKLYAKAKGAFEYHKRKFDEAKEKREYFVEIIFNIQNSKTYTELDEIESELEDCGLIKKTDEKKKPPKIVVEKVIYRDCEIYVGKNNKQNDYLISKIAKPDDIWFHAFNCPSSHVLIKLPDDKKAPAPEVLEYAAKLAKLNSPMKDSSKASIIYTRRKNLKKPPGGVLGYVIYKNEKEIVV